MQGIDRADFSNLENHDARQYGMDCWSAYGCSLLVSCDEIEGGNLVMGEASANA